MGALASAAMAWRSTDYGYYQRLMAAAAKIYAISLQSIARCAMSPCVPAKSTSAQLSGLHD